MKEKIAEIIAVLESLKCTEHYECEDGFYSCPKHPDYFGTDDREHCSCGMDYMNERLDWAIFLLNLLPI